MIRHALRTLALVLITFASLPAVAETLRIATYNTELGRKGPGILLRDLQRGKDPQIAAVIDTIIKANPHIIALQGVDYDLEGRALDALAARLQEAGAPYPFVFAAPPNAGMRTDLDLDGDGRRGGPGDAQGYGRFFGAGSMAILSRFPILTDQVADYSTMLWRNIPDALLPETAQGTPFPSAAAQAVQRLSSHGHWVVPIDHPSLGVVSVLTFHASPPVFDGPEDRNGRRNHDEVMFWAHLIDGRIGRITNRPFVLVGDANLDPERGDGRSEAIQHLLRHPALQDPLPGQPTVLWDQTGPMRVDYVLPTVDLTVHRAGITPANPMASRHRLVWVDVGR